jgi:hypothetical protein
MNKGAVLLLLLAGAGLATAQPSATPAPGPGPRTSISLVAANSGSATQAAGGSGTTPADMGPPDSHPWNPPVCHANIWPYAEPVQAGEPDCALPGDFWLVPEYLLWGIKGMRLPPLATAGAPAAPAVLGGPDVARQAFSGGRFTAGTWLSDDHSVGFEAGYFFLGERTDRFDATSGGGPSSPVLARPFTDVRTGQGGLLVVAGPDLGPGKVRASVSSALQGAPADLVYELYCCPQYRVELHGGFRYQDLDEELNVGDAGLIAPEVRLLGRREAAVVDQFNTRNVFFGGEFGARGEYCWNHLVGTLSANLALGSDLETIHVVGSTVVAARRRPISLPGGLLALPSNSGRFHDSEFSAIPQLGLQVGYQFNPYVRAFLGYNFLYWSNVARPGDQVDLGINPSQVPALHGTGPSAGPARPAFVVHEADFWAQGLNVGAEFRY